MVAAAAASGDDDSMNRRPSELNAATDLVGLSAPTPVGTSGTMKKVDEAELDKKPSSEGNGADDDIKKDVKKESVTATVDESTVAQEEPAASSSENKSKKEEDDAPMADTGAEATGASSAAAPQAPSKDPQDPAVIPASNGSANSVEPKQGPQGEASSAGGSASAAAAPSSAAAAASASSDGGHEGEGGDGPDSEKTAFPILLHEIVTDPATDDCIHWLSCGTRFMISDKKKFAKEVLPRFYGHAKFTSFTRRLKRWSFTRVPSGPFMGAYYNANFRRGEPELAARVRYDHPTPLSGAAMQLNKAKLQAVGAAMGGNPGAAGLAGAFGMNPLLAAAAAQQGGMSLSGDDKDMLLQQMNFMNAAGGMGMFPAMGGNPQLEALYRSMGQGGQGGNFAATNNSVALQMAMAQEMMQQRQAAAQMGMSPLDQARLLAQQQQLQQQRNNQGQMNLLQGGGGGQQQGGQGSGQGPEDQRMLAAMFLDRLNKQQSGSNPNMQQQQGQGNQNQGLPNATFPGSSMVSLTTTASSLPGSSGGLQGFNFPAQANQVTAGQSPNTSGASLSNNPLLNQPNVSNVSLTTLTGGRAQNNVTNSMNSAPMLNFPNPGGGGGGAGGGIGGGGSGGALSALQGMGGANASNNPSAMNALLADYLRRTSGAAPAGENGGGDNSGMGANNNETSC